MRAVRWPISAQTSITTKTSHDDGNVRRTKCTRETSEGKEKKKKKGARINPASVARSLPSPALRAIPRTCWCRRCFLCAGGSKTRHTVMLKMKPNTVHCHILMLWMEAGCGMHGRQGKANNTFIKQTGLGCLNIGFKRGNCGSPAQTDSWSWCLSLLQRSSYPWRPNYWQPSCPDQQLASWLHRWVCRTKGGGKFISSDNIRDEHESEWCRRASGCPHFVAVSSNEAIITTVPSSISFRNLIKGATSTQSHTRLTRGVRLSLNVQN